MRDTDYAYCVARVRAVESKMMSEDDLKKLQGFEKVSDALRFLKEKSWTASENESIREVISSEKENLWKLLSESVPDKSELSVLCTINDFFNIKASVKCLLTNASPESFIMKPTTVNTASIKENLIKRDFYTIFKNMAETAEKAYASAVESESGQIAEIIIDRAAVDYMASYSKNIEDKVTADVFGFIADTSNIKIAVRCMLTGKDEDFIDTAIGECIKLNREKLISSVIKGKEELYCYLENTVYKDGAALSEKSFSEFEKWCDEKLIEIASKSRYTSFAFSPICYYYYKKLIEINKINKILSKISIFSQDSEGQVVADV